jgi:DNA-binding NarL/FixJ family response regulator
VTKARAGERHLQAGRQRQRAGSTGVVERILVVDETPLGRSGIQAMLAATRDLYVAGEAATPDAALAAARRLRPDLIVIDPAMREADGMELLRALRRELPDVRVLVFTDRDDADLVTAEVQAGADGILLKHCTRAELLRAIHMLLRGEAVIDPYVAFQALRAAEPSTVARRGAGVPEPLTPRELEILRLIGRGHSNPQIARRLYVALGTVKAHVEHILGKLGAADRTEAAVRAAGLGLLDEPQRSAERPRPSGD